jgi:hypothetical protein
MRPDGTEQAIDERCLLRGTKPSTSLRKDYASRFLSTATAESGLNSTAQHLTHDQRAVTQLAPDDLRRDAAAAKRLFRCGAWNRLPENLQTTSPYGFPD